MSARLAAGLGALLDDGVRAGVFPAAAAAVSRAGAPPAVAVAGDATRATRWDLASLTKPMLTVTLAMRGVAEGWLDLDEPVPAGADAAGPGPAFAVRDLLAHRSGLPAWVDLAAEVDRRLGPYADGRWAPGEPAAAAAVEAHLAELARAAVPGARAVYSDLGFIALGAFLARRLGRPLTALHPGFMPPRPPADPAPFAPTGPCPFRERELRGEVHDLNTWVLGGAAGHAGLFATIDEVAAWAASLEAAAAGRADAPLPGAVVRAFWDAGNALPGDTWRLGWDSPSRPGYSSAGALLSPDSVGHLGFTGTSVWIDRERDLVVTLLTNRVALGAGSQEAIKRFRPAFHDAVVGLATAAR